MTQIDLKWFLPFVLPFAFLSTVKALWWVAGAEIVDPSLLAGICLVLGLTVGWLAAGIMTIEGIKWNVKIRW
jgi:ABC-type uncharacterized transport system permease subunit